MAASNGKASKSTPVHSSNTMSLSSSPDHPQVVTISYEELVQFSPVASDLSERLDAKIQKVVLEKIGRAFGNGQDCLGIIAVSGVPNFIELRQRVLPMAWQLANLPVEDLDQITMPSACYSVGWSHGQEKLAGPNNPPDLAKGSFYANPLTDNLLQDLKQRQVQASIDEDENEDDLDQLATDNPAFFAPNVWPTDSLPQLEDAVKELGRLIAQVGCLLARPCDVFVQQQCPTFPVGKLEQVLSTSRYAKARLLHYFAISESSTPPVSEDPTDEDNIVSADWCAWHKDHGSLTGLVPAMYLNADGREVLSSPDPLAGLYIQTRAGQILQVHLPPHVLAFQLGETSQIHTGGILRATPHAVRGPRIRIRRQRQREQQLGQCQPPSSTSHVDEWPNHKDALQLPLLLVTRESLAVFLEPEYHGDMHLPEGRLPEDIDDNPQHLPPSISPIQSRWKPGQNFGEFSNATFAAFY